jgi:hypothetical protein
MIGLIFRCMHTHDSVTSMPTLVIIEFVMMIKSANGWNWNDQKIRRLRHFLEFSKMLRWMSSSLKCEDQAPAKT